MYVATTPGPSRVGQTGEKRTFHSLRHTFARVAIEHNRPIFWLSKHLGHSSLDVTSGVYGHWRRRRAGEAEAMAGVVRRLIAAEASDACEAVNNRVDENPR